MIVRVPESPSTPSEQLVTLIDAHIRITISIPYNTTGIVTDLPHVANVTMLSLYLRYVTATSTAITRSNIPFLYSPHGALAASSRNPVIIAANTNMRYITISILTGANNRALAKNTSMNINPAPLGFPAESFPS